MRGFTMLAQGVGLSALLAIAVPAQAESLGDRAKQAIAEAHGKVDAATKAGVGGDAPGLTARAAQSLRLAEDSYMRGDKEAALLTAMQASRDADRAIGVANVNRIEGQAAQQADAAAATAEAQQEAALAQQNAANANARATAAEQSAALANAQANALRNPPAPQTTVTTERVASAVPGQTHTVRQTTTVTPGPGLTEQKRISTTVTTQPGGG